MHFLVNSLITLLFTIASAIAFFFVVTPTQAATNQFVTIVNPVRGEDFWQLKDETPLDNVKRDWDATNKLNLPATWLIRPDALQNKDIINFFKTFSSNQEIGLFMEVTPTWANDAAIKYRQSPNWHFAGSVLLTGYSQEERHKLVDKAFENYKKIFGIYPKSVGAWVIDAGSLSYMREKYGIEASLDVADQYTTDNYQVWGQYWSTPFYPAKRNAQVPASGEGQKLGIVTIQWATRDPFNAYGSGVLDSTYSVQANDYANPKFHNLGIDYFKKLLSIYLDNPLSLFGQVTIGLENDFSWKDFGRQYSEQLEVISQRQKSGTRVVTMSQFANSYKSLYPVVSPPQIIAADDPLGSGGKVVWFQTPRYRVSWFFTARGSVVRDLRLYHDSVDEPCSAKSCDNLNFAIIQDQSIDEVTFRNPWVIDEGKISDIKVTALTEGLSITYKNQIGVQRSIEFLPHDIKVDNTTKPIPVVISEAIQASKNIKKIEHSFGNHLINIRDVLQKQLLSVLLFLGFSILFFYLPGLAVIKNATLETNNKFILSWVIGIGLFTLLSYILGYLKLSVILGGLPLAALLIVKKQWILPAVSLSKEALLAGFVIFAGSITWLLTSVKNGLMYDYGLGFWGPHGHDGIWHISLIERLKEGLPPENPVFAGTLLQNYHYFYDLLLVSAANVTRLEVIDLYFRLFPLLLSILTGLVVYILSKEWFKNSTTAILSCFFVYFGGSFGWVLSYLQTKGLGGETVFWAQQSISTLINPPYAISLVIFLAGLYLFHKVVGQKDQVVSLVIPLIILWGTLIEFKAYAGVLVLGALAVVTLVEIVKNNFSFLKVSIPIALLSAAVFLPNNLGGPALLVLSPFWLIHSMIDFPDRLYWMRIMNARLSGLETGNWFKLLTAEGIGLISFLVGNLGTRILGLLSVKSLWPLNSFNLFVVIFLLLSLIIPLLFIQKGANFNIVQFFYYFLLIFNFLAAAALAGLIQKLKTLGLVIAGTIIILTIPTTWDTLHHYIPTRPPSRISQAEVEALQYLRFQPNGVVLSYPHDDRLKQRFTEPVPMSAYAPTAYVGAISGKSEYIADNINLEILGIDYKGRLQATKDILALREPEVIKRLLTEENISYVYIPKFLNITVDESRFPIKKIFSNEEVEIFKVNN